MINKLYPSATRIAITNITIWWIVIVVIMYRIGDRRYYKEQIGNQNMIKHHFININIAIDKNRIYNTNR